MPAVLELVEAAGEADEDFEKAKPYLEAFGVIARRLAAATATPRARGRRRS